MEGFVSGEKGVLDATTVIDVGVNVANASLMVIETADRSALRISSAPGRDSAAANSPIA